MTTRNLMTSITNINSMIMMSMMSMPMIYRINLMTRLSPMFVKTLRFPKC